MTIHDPLHPTAEALFQEFLETFAKSAIEAYQYFDAEYGNNGDDQSRDAAVAAVLDEGHLGPDIFAGTGADLIRTERDRLHAALQQLVMALDHDHKLNIEARNLCAEHLLCPRCAAVRTTIAALAAARAVLGTSE